MLDPLGISIAIANGNLGLDAACIWFKPLQHLNVVPLVLEVNDELANFATEVIAVPGELLDSEAMEDLVVVNGGDKTEGDGTDSVIEVVLHCQYCKGCLW